LAILIQSSLLLLAPMFTGCSPAIEAQMAVPPDVGSSTDEVAVRGRIRGRRQEDFRIGDFQVANILRGASSLDVYLGVAGLQRQGDTMYSFDVRHGDDTVHGECTSEVNDAAMSAGLADITDGGARLVCACGNRTAPDVGVSLDASVRRDYAGSLKAHEATYQVKAINERHDGSKASSPAGFRVDGEGVAAAVDVLGGGRVWMGKELDGVQRSDLTCVIAGLLLYEPPRRR
jgi:hypothetical protein